MKLKEICDISNGSILSRFQTDSMEKQKFNIISVKAALGDDKDIHEEYLNPSQLAIAKKGDLIMGMTQPNVFVIEEPLVGWVIPSTFAYFRIIDSQKVDPYYLKWFFEYSTEYHQQLHLLKNAGGKVQFLKIGTLKELEITLPPIKHQKKIAKIIQCITKEKVLYAKKINLQIQLMNYQGNKWIKENKHGS